MEKFEIWMEGFAATGQRATAQMIGESRGVNFDDAVERYMRAHPEEKIERNTHARYVSEEAYKNRKSNWNIWACNLFDNEADARKSFG